MGVGNKNIAHPLIECGEGRQSPPWPIPFMSKLTIEEFYNLEHSMTKMAIRFRSRQDFDHEHKGMKPHEHHSEFNKKGQMTSSKKVTELNSDGYGKPSCPIN